MVLLAAWQFLHPGVGPNTWMTVSVMLTRCGTYLEFMFIASVMFFLPSRQGTFRAACCWVIMPLAGPRMRSCNCSAAKVAVFTDTCP